MSLQAGMKQKGTLTKWFDDKGFGFIVPDASPATEVFVHHRAFKGNRPTGGEKVEFDIITDPQRNKPKANNAVVVGAPPNVPGMSLGMDMHQRHAPATNGHSHEGMPPPTHHHHENHSHHHHHHHHNQPHHHHHHQHHPHHHHHHQHHPGMMPEGWPHQPMYPGYPYYPPYPYGYGMPYPAPYPQYPGWPPM
ncbi:hypothetical protein DIPPA_05845 [Diplonema papillatum]|nr:hypothetical protein DIPPA_05845 [Diplonema papillatum]